MRAFSSPWEGTSGTGGARYASEGKVRNSVTEEWTERAEASNSFCSQRPPLALEKILTLAREYIEKTYFLRRYVKRHRAQIHFRVVLYARQYEENPCGKKSQY